MRRKKIIKLVLLIFSFIPYFVFLILGIKNCLDEKIAHSGTYFDMYDLIRPLGDVWDMAIRHFNILYILIFLFAIAYPIYFIVDSLSSRNVEKEKNISTYENKPELKKSFIFYMSTFIPYLLLVYVAIFGMEFFGRIYGFEAVVLILALFSYLPVFPTLFIFQLIFTIKNRKNFSHK